MKKEYKKPQTCTVKLQQVQMLCASGDPDGLNTLMGTEDDWVEIE